MLGATKRTAAAFLLPAIVLLAAALEAYAEGPKDLSKIAGWQGAAPTSARAFSFVVVSDRTGGHVEGEWAAAVEQVNLLQPDFVICVGDLIEGYTENEATLLRQWEEFEAMTNEFDAPFFYCPGNHDVSNEVMWKLYCQRHARNGKSYYSFDYRSCHFVVLDTNTAMRSESFAQEQFTWLAKDLKRAKNAKHVFVFYHHPRWSKAHAINPVGKGNHLWSQFRELLPTDKTTIFNGHYHGLSFQLIGGIPEYILSATGARVGQAGFRMFAQVTVNRGKPTVALLPLHVILPTSYAEIAANVRSITLSGNLIPAEGGTFIFKHQNQLSVPMTIDLQWQGKGWTVEPEVGKSIVEAGAVIEKTFLLTPLATGPDKPTISATYTITDSYRKHQLSIEREKVLGIYTQMDIPYASGISIDGDLSDWSTVEALRIADEAYIFVGRNDWSGREDSSFDMRVAFDDKRLFLAMDVTDDQICVDGEQAWRNDGMEFFWDMRPTARRNGHHGQGTGQVILVVPKESRQEVKPEWHMGQRAIPEALKAVCKRRDGGYVFELSIPLSELGDTTAPIAGQKIWLTAMVTQTDRF